MAKIKVKDIQTIAEDAKNRMLNIEENANIRIGIIVSEENFSTSRNYAYNLAKTVEREIHKNNIETEIVLIPTLNDRYKSFTNQSNLIEVYKEQLTGFMELLLTEKMFDGVILISKGLSSNIGFLRSAIRQSLPTVVLSVGPSPIQKGKTLKELVSMAGQLAINKCNAFEIQENETQQIENLGNGVGFSTENILNLVFEGIGLAVKNSGTAPSGSIEREQIAKQSATTIVSLVKDRANVKKLLSKKMLQNALVINAALGGSTQVFNNILNLYDELEIDYKIEKLFDLVKNVPVLVDTKNTTIADFAANKGVAGLLKTLSTLKLLDESAKVYSGATITEIFSTVKKAEGFEKVTKDSFTLLHGNIAERYAIAKTINIPTDLTKFEGKAYVVKSDEEGANAILNRAFEKGVLVIQNAGKVSGLGGTIVSQSAIAVESMEKQNDIIIITDGEVPDEANTIVIGNITPETNGGNLAYIKEGDTIEIDFVKGRINAEINAKEFNTRQKKFVKEVKEIPAFIKHYLKNIK